MNTKLILVEGIPGSGKTTIAKKIEKFLAEKNIPAECFVEGELHPADLAWLSYLTCEEYNDLIIKYPLHKDLLENNSIIDEDYALIAYTRLGFHPDQNPLMSYLQTKEIFDGKLSIQDFLNINLKRWRKFCQKAVSEDKVYIFECAFLQNHINELIAINDVEDDFLLEYFKKLECTVEQLNPALIYLEQADINKTIDHIAKERVSEDKKAMPDWIDYVEKSKYGKKHDINGFDGVIKYFEKRVEAEKKIIKHLNMKTFIATRQNDDWGNLLLNTFEHIEHIL